MLFRVASPNCLQLWRSGIELTVQRHCSGDGLSVVENAKCGVCLWVGD